MAEEATQEVFILVWRKINSFAGNSSFSTWLHSLTTNTTISYLRKQRSWLQKVRGSTDYDAIAEQIEASPMTSTEGLQEAISRLPERARLVFVLHAIEGYRQDTIAKALSISTGAVKAQFHRAKQLMLDWIGENTPEI